MVLNGVTIQSKGQANVLTNNRWPSQLLHDYFRRLSHNAHEILKGFPAEVIHLFRVDVKKLRAFLRMMRPASGEPEQLKFPRKFKKMYALTGKIRDRQLCIKRLHRNNKTRDKEFQHSLSSLHDQIRDLSAKEDTFLTKREFKEIEKEMANRLPLFPGPGLIKDFFRQKLQAINIVISGGEFKDEELHNIRKSIKDIIYILQIFRDDLKAPLPFTFWNDNEVKQAEALSHKLGLFNDACIALELLPSADHKDIDRQEQEHLQKVRRQWQARKQRLKQNIVKEISATFHLWDAGALTS